MDFTTALRLSAVLCTVAAPAQAADGPPATPAPTHAEQPPAPSGVLSLRDAVAAALAGSPDLRAFQAEVRARDALVLQAGRVPNPELQATAEDLGGSGDRGGVEQTETTLRLSQLIELGGKRGGRRQVAALTRELAAWDYESQRLGVLSETTKAFVTTLAAQERRDLAADMERLARESLTALERSARAGASSPVEVTRARVTLGRAEMERGRAAHELHATRSLLAARWGASQATFTRVEGDLHTLGPLPVEDRVLQALGQNPDLARWETERREREASVDLEKANGVPDVTVAAGGRHFADNDDTALVLGLSVPLPLFDRNQGAIAAARHRLEKAREESNAALVNTRSALALAYGRLASAHELASVLRGRVLVDAETSLGGTLDAFGKGLLRPVDLFEAQRTLFDLRGEYVRALESFHLAAADVERLTATSIRELSQRGDQ